MPRLVTHARRDALRVAGISPSRAYLFAVQEINCLINYEPTLDAISFRSAFPNRVI
jgi:hypothetical protein